MITDETEKLRQKLINTITNGTQGNTGIPNHELLQNALIEEINQTIDIYTNLTMTRECLNCGYQYTMMNKQCPRCQDHDYMITNLNEEMKTKKRMK